MTKEGKGRPAKNHPAQAIKCRICGDTGVVLRGYIEPELGLPKARERVACPHTKEVTK